jgi:sugar lactone lactonase YvrE
MPNIYEPVINVLGYGTVGPSGGPGTVELFVATDIYRYDIDNRPLEHLVDNDAAIKAATDALVGEIRDAHFGRLWPDGVADYDHNTLDTRLDNMDDFLQEFFEVRNVQYSSFIQFSNFLKERFTSGFMNGPFPDKFIRSNYSMENNEMMPSPFGGFYVPERAQTVRDTDTPDEDTIRLLGIETRIEQDGTSWKGKRKPLYAHVNGFIVPMLNEAGGTKDALETIDGRRANGTWGPIHINFPTAPSTGHRFDFAFLEVWQKEVIVGSDWFYPYGSRDWSEWGKETLAVTAGGATHYEGQIDDRRDMVTKDETGWEFYIILLDDPNDPIDWTLRDGEGNGLGGLVPNTLGDPWGYNISGTVDPNTLEWSLDFTGVVPPDGKYIVVSLRTKGFENPDRDNVRGTISFLPNGNYLQIQHRIRVVPGVDYESYPEWFQDPKVLGRGPKDAPVSNYFYRNSLNDFHDGSMYHAGNGNSASKVALGTLDGYIYAIPICVWSRYNSGPWTILNQNGGVDRPDGGHFNSISDKQLIDLRPVILAERYNLEAAAENTLDRILRGEHHSIFAEGMTDYADTDTWVGNGSWGVEVPELWRVLPKAGTGLTSGINTVRDIGLADSNDPTDVGPWPLPIYAAPIAFHDGIRQIFSPQEEVQQVPIHIEDVSTSTNALPDELVTYNNVTKTITISTESADVSGAYLSALGGVERVIKGAIVNDSYPRLFWRGSRQPVILSTLWQGLGTRTATAVIDDTAASFVPNGEIDGFVDLLYPESTGIARPLKQVDYVEVKDGAQTYKTLVKGNDDGSPDSSDIVKWKLDNGLEPGFQLPSGACSSPDNLFIYVCDSANNRVVKLNASTLAQVAQWPTPVNYPVPSVFNLSLHLKYPVDVAVHETSPGVWDVYVADREDHRIVKLNQDLNGYLGAFGTSGILTNDPFDTGALNSPEGVTVDSSGNVFIADTGLYRLIKLNSGLTYVTQLGDGVSNASQNQFVNPTGLDVGNVGGDDYVYVTDRDRLVQVDATNMTTYNVIGSGNSEAMNRFFRPLSNSFFGFAEDAAGNKFASNCDRGVLYKFDASWNVIASWGEDGVKAWDDTHLSHPLDLEYDEEAGLIYVADANHSTPIDDHWRATNNTRVGIWRASDLHFYGWLDMVPFLPATAINRFTIGLAIVQDAGLNGKLYVSCGSNIIKFALPIPALRSEAVDAQNGVGGATPWTVDWVLTPSTPGFLKSTGDWFQHVRDLTVTSAGDILLAGDPIRGEVVKIDPTTNPPTFIDRLVVGRNTPPDAGNDRYSAPFGQVLNAGETLLFTGGGKWNDGAVPNCLDKSFIRVIDFVSTPMTIVGGYFDNEHWVEGVSADTASRATTVFNMKPDKDGNMWMLLDSDTLLYEQPFTPSAGDISANFIYSVSEIPVTIDLGLAIPWLNARAVHFKNNIIYVTDVAANTVTAFDATSLMVLGQVGSPAMVNRGMASTAGPSGVAVIGNRIYVVDTYNNRVLTSYRHFPYVERGTGRVQFLIAPPDTAMTTFQARYTPYQGKWDKLARVGPVYGRNFVTDNNLIYVTTMGRGTPTRVSPDSGLSFYSNMIQRIPCPIDVPEKSPRVTDEYLFAPELLPITDVGATPFLRLPVLNRYPSSAQEMQPLYGGGSRFDFTRFFFLQGPGRGWAVDESGAPTNTPPSWTPRGYYGNGVFPGFDTMMTFPLQSISIPRILFSSMVVELEGEGYLLIYSCYRSAAGNVINDGSPIAVDVFKLFGNPGIKTRY